MNEVREKRKKFWNFILFKILPFVISIIAITLSIITFTEKHREVLKISVTRNYSNYKTDIIKVENDKKYPARVKMKFNILLINNSEKPVTIRSYKLEEVKENGLENYGKNVCGLINKRGENIEFPFSIDPYKSKRLEITIGLKVAKGSYDILMKNFKSPLQIPIRDIEKTLLENGTDIYGNEIKVMVKGENTSAYGYYKDFMDKQNFILSFKTIRKNVYSTVFSLY